MLFPWWQTLDKMMERHRWLGQGSWSWDHLGQNKVAVQTSCFGGMRSIQGQIPNNISAEVLDPFVQRHKHMIPQCLTCHCMGSHKSEPQHDKFILRDRWVGRIEEPLCFRATRCQHADREGKRKSRLSLLLWQLGRKQKEDLMFWWDREDMMRQGTQTTEDQWRILCP